MQMEGFGGARFWLGQLGRLGLLAGFVVFMVGAPRQRLQQLARILEVAAPQHGRAFASQAIRLVSRRAVVGDDDALRWRHAAFRAPAGRMVGAVFAPVYLRMGGI